MKAPNFKLMDKDGNAHELYDIRSAYVIVYFYPKDNTPGCTIEANQFNELLGEFSNLGVEIIGISGGDEGSKKKFCERNNLRLTLLSDTDFAVSKKYDAYGEKKFMGRTYNGILRVTYILDKDKKIIKSYGIVKPLQHSKEVLEFIKSL